MHEYFINLLADPLSIAWPGSITLNTPKITLQFPKIHYADLFFPDESLSRHIVIENVF